MTLMENIKRDKRTSESILSVADASNSPEVKWKGTLLYTYIYMCGIENRREEKM